MNRIRQKLRSRRGASITFALLLFLVCAVLCSVIVTAGTAAAGRMSNIAETDKRYYAVTSACGLLKDLIDGKIMSVVEVTTTSTTRTYQNGSLTSTGEPEQKSRKVYLVAGQAKGMTAEELAASAKEINETNSTSNIVEDAAYRFANMTGEAVSRDLSLTSTLDKDSKNKDPLAVDIRETISRNGDITLTVGKENQFQEQMIFSGSESTGESTTSYDKAPEESDTGGHSIETVTTKIKTTTLRWSLTGVNTVDGSATAH